MSDEREPESNGGIMALALVMLALGMLLGTMFGWHVGEKRGTLLLQREAIKAKAAEWRVDSETGTPYFYWLNHAEATP